ncbi:MAG: EAL domain-containing protein [Magnetococcales bacterium]|nr:EAL domain-containing protein [Magnetococcales bacterium]
MAYGLVHITLVLFGLLYFYLGSSVWIRSRAFRDRPIANHFGWLAGFGVLHGIQELLNIPLSMATGPAMLESLTLLVGVTSMFLLMQFGVSTLTLLTPRTPRLLGWIPGALFAVWCALFTASTLLDGHLFEPLSVWGYLLFGTGGTLTTALIFLRYPERLSSDKRAQRSLRWAGWSFLLYFLLMLLLPLIQLTPGRFPNLANFFSGYTPPIFLLFAVTTAAVALSLGRSLELFSDLEAQRLTHSIEQSTQTLRFSEEKFRNLFQNSQDAIFIADAVTEVIVDVNRAAEQLTGRSKESLIGHYQTQLFTNSGGQDHAFRRLFGPMSTPQEGIHLESAVHHHSGTQIPVDLTASTFVSDQWRLVQTICRNITKRRDTEQELIQNRSRLAKAQAIAHLGHWEWNIHTRTLFWSDEIYRIFGVSPRAFRPTYDGFLGFIHPHDRHRVEHAVNQAIKDPAFQYNLQHRIICEDGTERTVHELGEIKRDEEGQPIRMMGTIQDITALKEAEQRVHETREVLYEVEEQLMVTTKVFESALEGVMITDSKTRIQSINPAFTLITGYSEAEVIGKTPRILRSDRHEKAFYEHLWDELAKNGQWQGEIWNRRKSGEAYPEWLTITAISDRHDGIKHYIGVFSDLSDLKQSQDELLFNLHHDALTQLPTRSVFLDRCAQSIKSSQAHEQVLAVLLINMDHFAVINASQGFDLGDRLLQKIAWRLKARVVTGETLSRLGGDEFALLVPHLESGGNALLAVIQRLQQALMRPFELDEHRLTVTACIGIATYPHDGNEPGDLIRNANIALKRAKGQGGDSVQYFEATMGENANRRLELESQMRLALDQSEFLLHYQPKLDLATGEVTSMECLVRWERPGHGLVSPGEFIPVAEESALMIPIGRWIIHEVCRQLHAWDKAGLPPLRAAVNLSARQFQKQLLETIDQALERHHLTPDRLEMEITESAIMRDMEQTMTLLDQMRERGIQLSIDDFGTGHASLSYLKRFPVQTLKIDRSFIRDIEQDSQDKAIVSAIISMGHNLGLKVVAEGVETQAQLTFLQEKQSDQIQGYYFCRPVAAEAFQAFIQKHVMERKAG